MNILNPSIAYVLFSSIILLYSCRAQTQSEPSTSTKSTPANQALLLVDQDIAEYIRNIYQDKNGHFWLGTNGHGVAHYNGITISYFSNAEGFGGQQITGISEDLDKNIWFSTDQGIVKYEWDSRDDKKQFINYSDKKLFAGQRFWSIYADSKGKVWAGAERGIYRYDGESWTIFEIPYPDKITGTFITAGTTWSIAEDSEDNMWFSTNGYGAYKYDGKSFTQYTKEDGLTDNSVDNIMEDSNGNMWFGTRHGGVSRYDGKTFTNYSSRDGNSITNDEVCAIYEDSKGNIWVSSEGYGVYRYDGKTFANYSQAEGLGVSAAQTIYEDKEGRLWVGGGGGLYRFDGQKFVNITKYGPWE